jgi:ubiquinone/menaquinone biosynthesis C-methylase UbiE
MNNMINKPNKSKKSASITNQKRDWDELASVDPLFAIIPDPKGRFGKWDQAKFFLTGEIEITAVMEHVKKANYLFGRDRALDFGCGVGRLTRALAKHFGESNGVDVSENMVAQAIELNKGVPNCKFVANPEEHLGLFADNYFDLVYTNQVLQHVPNKFTVESYISEFLRIIKPGGLLIFQMPCYIKPVYRLQPTRRLYSLLRLVGFSAEFLYKRLRLQPIRVIAIPEADIVSFLHKIGANVLEIESRVDIITADKTYYVTK